MCTHIRNSDFLFRRNVRYRRSTESEYRYQNGVSGNRVTKSHQLVLKPFQVPIYPWLAMQVWVSDANRWTNKSEQWILLLTCYFMVQFGYIVLTTSAGIMDHDEARRKNVGGKVLGFFYWGDPGSYFRTYASQQSCTEGSGCWAWPKCQGRWGAGVRAKFSVELSLPAIFGNILPQVALYLYLFKPVMVQLFTSCDVPFIFAKCHKCR